MLKRVAALEDFPDELGRKGVEARTRGCRHAQQRDGQRVAVSYGVSQLKVSRP